MQNGDTYIGIGVSDLRDVARISLPSPVEEETATREVGGEAARSSSSPDTQSMMLS